VKLKDTWASPESSSSTCLNDFPSSWIVTFFSSTPCALPGLASNEEVTAQRRARTHVESLITARQKDRKGSGSPCFFIYLHGFKLTAVSTPRVPGHGLCSAFSLSL